MVSLESTRLSLTSSISPSKLVLVVIIASYCSGFIPLRQSPPVLQALVKLINKTQSTGQHGAGVGKELENDLENTQKLSSLIYADLDFILSQLELQMRLSGTKNGLSPLETDKDVKRVKQVILLILFSFKESGSFADFIRGSAEFLAEDTLDGQKKLESRNSKDRLLTKTSFLGRFVHSICLSFKYLEFEKMVLLWRAFDQYRRNTKEPQAKKLMDLEPSSMEMLLSAQLAYNTDTDDASVLVIPQTDLANLIEHQIYLSESFGTPTPPEISKMLELVAKMEPGSLPSGHYIKYLECLKDADFEGAFENLHRYFDYMMSSKQRPLYHYLLLSLATLYATFSDNQQLVSAIGEAIIVARENKDLTCLNYLLTWVYNFAKDRPQLELVIGKDYSDKQKILNFLKLHTKESKNKQLQSIFYQFRALQELNDGGQLHSIFEDLSISTYLSLLYDEENDNDSVDFAIFAKSCNLMSTLWLRLGLTALLEAYLDIGLDSCSSQQNVYDQVSISIKKAYLEFYKENYDEAFKIFDDLEPIVLKNGYLFKTWESRRLALTVNLHLKNGQLDLAHALLGKLTAQSEFLNDVEFQNEIDSLNAMLEEATI